METFRKAADRQTQTPGSKRLECYSTLGNKRNRERETRREPETYGVVCEWRWIETPINTASKNSSSQHRRRKNREGTRRRSGSNNETERERLDWAALEQEEGEERTGGVTNSWPLVTPAPQSGDRMGGKEDSHRGILEREEEMEELGMGRCRRMIRAERVRGWQGQWTMLGRWQHRGTWWSSSSAQSHLNPGVKLV